MHAIVDDHSRLAYAEIHDDAKAATVAGFLERALRFYAEHGINRERLMTDNAWAYARSRARPATARRGTRSATSRPSPTGRAPTARSSASTRRWRANGPTASSTAHTTTRAAALPHWLDHYNTARPHSSLGGQPPISRVHNLCGQDI